ncbi:MAG: hypothetical protein DCC67_00130 [Planctomycetota bacterium]|nr:MAG: hypothetical protein DCC67_00130 [Planctomycetota bacterium]
MEQVDDFPSGRFERKFLVTDSVAVAVREAIQPYLERDVHMPPASTRGYAVYSVYYDTPNLDLYRQTRQGAARRFKLRLRYYDDRPDTLAFVEVKEKIKGQVFKRRYAADKALAEALLHHPDGEALQHALTNGAAGTALEEFCQRRLSLGATPKLLVGYEREAYNSSGEPKVRLTFDRRIKTVACGRSIRLDAPRYGSSVGGLNVLLEVKYTGQPPEWFTEIRQKLTLKRTSFSKFAECIDALQLCGPQPHPHWRRPSKKGSKKAG